MERSQSSHDDDNKTDAWTRRDVVIIATATVLGSSQGMISLAETSLREHVDPTFKAGLLTDVHYADKDTAGSRHYRDSIAKIRRAVSHFNEVGVDFAVELGDFIDAAGGDVELEIDYLKRIDREFAKLEDATRHYVFGNHCIDILTKDEFLKHSDAETVPPYSFDHGSFHHVILDACFRSTGEPYGRRNGHWTDTIIPPLQLAWLRADLAKTSHPTIIYVHQRLDPTKSHSVKNHDDVRKVLEESGRVIAVFQGHSHANAHHEINGIHYVVFRGMVEGPGAAENNGFGVMHGFEDGSLAIRGVGQQENYRFRHK